MLDFFSNILLIPYIGFFIGIGILQAILGFFYRLCRSHAEIKCMHIISFFIMSGYIGFSIFLWGKTTFANGFIDGIISIIQKFFWLIEPLVALLLIGIVINGMKAIWEAIKRIALNFIEHCTKNP